MGRKVITQEQLRTPGTGEIKAPNVIPLAIPANISRGIPTNVPTAKLTKTQTPIPRAIPADAYGVVPGELKDTITEDYKGEVNGSNPNEKDEDLIGANRKLMSVSEPMYETSNGIWHSKNRAVIPVPGFEEQYYNGLVKILGKSCVEILNLLNENKIQYMINVDHDGATIVNGRILSKNLIDILSSTSEEPDVEPSNTLEAVKLARATFPAGEYAAVFLPKSLDSMQRWGKVYDFDKNGFYINTTTVKYEKDRNFDAQGNLISVDNSPFEIE